MTDTARAAAAMVLLMSGYLLAVVLGLVALVGGLGLLAAGPSPLWVALLVIPLLALVALARLWTAGRAARVDVADEEVPLAQTAQPRLWAEVMSIADRVGSRAPDEIAVVDRVTVELVEDIQLLGLRSGRRRLVLGIPLMLGLSAEQLRFVMAHELAHDSDHQPSMRTRVYRGAASARRLRATAPDTLTGRLLASLAVTYAGVTAPLARAQELAADRLAADVVGSRTAVAALREVGPLTEAWDEFCEHYVLTAAGVGQRPEGVFEGFMEFLDDEDRQDWMAAYADRHPADPYPPPGHPRLEERVAALKALTTSRQLDFSGAAEEVLDRPDAVYDALESAVTEGSDLRPGPFERVVPRGTAARVTAQVEALGRAARQLDQWPLQEEHLLQVVTAGRAAPLLRTMAPDADGEELDRLAWRAVADLVAHRLVEAGTASFTMSWGHAPLLTTSGGETLDPWSVAARATRSPEGVSELKAWLASHRVRLARPTTPAPAAEVVAEEAAQPDRGSRVKAARRSAEPPTERDDQRARTSSPTASPRPEPSTPAALLPAAAESAPTKPKRPKVRPQLGPLLRRITETGPPPAPAAPEIARDPAPVASPAPAPGAIAARVAEALGAPPVAERPSPPEPGIVIHEGVPAGPTQRETLKAALKELDRARQAQEKAERETGAASRQGRILQVPVFDETSTEADADEATPVPTINESLLAAIAAFEEEPDARRRDVVEPPAADGPETASETTAEPAAAAPEAPAPIRVQPTTGPPSGEDARDLPDGAPAEQPAGQPVEEPVEAPVGAVAASVVAPAAGPALEEPTGVLAAAAPIAGSARGTLVVSPIGISLRRADLAEKVRLAKARAAQGTALLSRAVGLSVHELTGHRGTDTLAWADITEAEFSGLSEDAGVLTLYVGGRAARRVEFLSTTEIHGDLLGVLERLLGPRLRLS